MFLFGEMDPLDDIVEEKNPFTMKNISFDSNEIEENEKQIDHVGKKTVDSYLSKHLGLHTNIQSFYTLFIQFFVLGGMAAHYWYILFQYQTLERCPVWCYFLHISALITFYARPYWHHCR